jgi:ABC-type anion transport system duplicated permease subunit
MVRTHPCASRIRFLPRRILCRDRRRLGGCLDSGAIWDIYADPRFRPHRARVTDLGTYRRVDRFAAPFGREDSVTRQFLAAFPANLLFPVFVVGIVCFHANADIWTSPLIVLGTQWYILFNVIAGATAYPTDLREAAINFGVRRWQWCRDAMLPGVFPYFITGAITASGGAWNASVVAESVSWGKTTITAHGLGAYIAQATNAGDFPRLVLGITVMSLLVTLFNRLIWRPLYRYAEERTRLC